MVVERCTLGAQSRLLELGLGSLAQALDELFQGGGGVNREVSGDVAADGTVGLLLVFKGVRVHALVAAVHHVIHQIRVATGGDLEGLVAAARGHDGIGRGDGRDDIFDNSLGQRISYSGDFEFFGAT